MTNSAVIEAPVEDESPVMTVEEAGRRLGMGRAAAYVHAKAGHFPVIKLGKRIFVPKKAFQRMLDGV